MEEGHFENLPGKGKPLDLNTNPHADPSEDTLYRILSKNGCAPEWVELNKQIRSDAAEWRSALKKAWAYNINGNNAKWIECSEVLKVQMNAINNKVRGFILCADFIRFYTFVFILLLNVLTSNLFVQQTGVSLQLSCTIWSSDVWYQVGKGT